MEQNNRISFEQWLSFNNVKKPIPNFIIAAFEEVSDFAVSRKLSKSTIWNISTVRDFALLRTALEKNRLFRILHRNAAHVFEKSWRYYATFLKSLEEDAISNNGITVVTHTSVNPEPIPTTEADSVKDYSLEAFSHWLANEIQMAPASCRGYASSIRSISEYAVENGWLVKMIYEIASEEELRETVAVLRNIDEYIEYNEKQHNRFSAAIHKYMIFRTGSDTRTQKRTTKRLSPMVNEKSEYFDTIVALLKKKYKFGFRYNSPIEMIRFRQFAEMENMLLPEVDELLKTEIQNAGFIVEDKVYVIDDEAGQEFIDIINDVMHQGHRIIFYEALQEHQSEWLMEHHIVSQDVLKEFLSHNSDRFYLGKNFMTPGERLTEIEAIVCELKRIWGKGLLLNFASMSERLPMIPLDRIKHAISCSTEFVWNSEETYALLDHVIISDPEKSAIKEFVKSTCEIVGYASLSDIPLGSIAEVNYELSDTALYNAIYNKVLLGEFYLNGKILTTTESTISAISIVKAYCANKSECSFDELSNRVIELIGGTNRQYAFEAAYDTLVRVEANRFVAERYVNFEIDAVDALLDDLITDDFIAIKGIATFALFPFCGQSWNYYLLESFCYRFSKKYRLEVMNFNDKNAGIIAKKTCNLKYQEMLAVAAARADIALTTEDVGAFLFASGYMAKRKYAGLSNIVERAKGLRERKN